MPWLFSHFNRTTDMRNPTHFSNNLVICTQVVEDKKGTSYDIPGNKLRLSKSSPQEAWLGPLQQMRRHNGYHGQKLI